MEALRIIMYSAGFVSNFLTQLYHLSDTERWKHQPFHMSISPEEKKRTAAFCYSLSKFTDNFTPEVLSAWKPFIVTRFAQDTSMRFVFASLNLLFWKLELNYSITAVGTWTKDNSTLDEMFEGESQYQKSRCQCAGLQHQTAIILLTDQRLPYKYYYSISPGTTYKI